MPEYTKKQGQYLAFIYNYTKIKGRPSAEADMQRYFRVSPPTVHQMVLTRGSGGSLAGNQGRRGVSGVAAARGASLP
jgi:hypothetical protein